MELYAGSMLAFQVERARLQPLNDDSVADLCWMAREILGGYMEGEPEPELSDEAEALAASCYDDTLEHSGDPPKIYQTTPIPINTKQEVTLSNLPFIVDPEGKPMPLLEPGYVSLMADPVEMEDDGCDPEKKRGSPYEDCAQLVFRMPRQGERAAIFEGFELDESNAITAEQTSKLKHIRMLLECVRVGLRDLMENDIDSYQVMYHSQAPVPSALNGIDDAYEELVSGYGPSQSQ